MEITGSNSEVVLKAVQIARRKVNEFFDELEVEILESKGSAEAEGRSSDDSKVWVLDREPLRGSWVKTSEESDQSYRWPDGNVDQYVKFTRYAGKGDYLGLEAAIGYKANGEVIGFLVTKADKRGLVFFQPADDFEDTGELLSMVRGGGDSGKAGFHPNSPEPPAYAEMKLQSLKQRIHGKWNVLAVVAKPTDIDSILGHTALQARLRGLA